MAILHEVVFLLHAEPGLLVRIFLSNLDTGRSRIGLVWCHVGVETLAQYQHVTAAPDRVRGPS